MVYFKQLFDVTLMVFKNLRHGFMRRLYVIGTIKVSIVYYEIVSICGSLILENIYFDRMKAILLSSCTPNMYVLKFEA